MCYAELPSDEGKKLHFGEHWESNDVALFMLMVYKFVILSIGKS